MPFGTASWLVLHGLKAVAELKRPHAQSMAVPRLVSPRHQSRGRIEAPTFFSVIGRGPVSPRYQSRGRIEAC